MPKQTDETTPQKQTRAYGENVELGSFTQNIVAFEAIVGRMEAEVFGPDPNVDRLNIYQSEIQSMLGELQAQQARAIAAHGGNNENVQRFQGLLTGKLTRIVNKVDSILSESQSRLADLNRQLNALESMSANAVVPEVREALSTYQVSPAPAKAVPTGSNYDFIETLTAATQHLGKVIAAHPETKQDYLPVLEQLLALSLRSITKMHGSASGQPPRGPVDTPPERGDDGGMEPRIVKLEQFAEDCRKDLRSIDVRLAKVETLAEGIAKNMATKAEISQLEATLLKWFVGTAIALTGLAFAAAKLFH